MAISGGDGSIILNTNVDTKGLSKGIGSMKKMVASAGKAFAAVGVAAAAATVAITKMAVSAYADYEQLVGGVETLFKGSAGKVVEYANQAFQTAGMSANRYMEVITSFSASLINSLGGDTEKAADYGNQALIDMSDNANKMGSDMEMIVGTYQSLSRGNFSMLDNLKLGYGGTRTEMERLLRDAEAYKASQGEMVKYSISNFADITQAIGAIQEKMGIAGATMEEAEGTISGSLGMVKASWQNLIAAIAGGGDLERAINNFVYSLEKATENLVPVIERALLGLGKAIERILPMLVQSIVSALIKAIPSLVVAVYKMILGLFKGLISGVKALFSGGTASVTEVMKNDVGGIADASAQAADNMNSMAKETKKAAKEANNATASFDALNILSSGGGDSATGGADTAMPATGGATSIGVPSLIPQISETSGAETKFGEFTQRMRKMLSPLEESFGKLFKRIGESFNETDWEGMAKSFGEWRGNLASADIEAIAKGIDSIRVAWEALEEPLGRVWRDVVQPIFKKIGEWILKIVKQTGESFDYFSEKVTEYEEEIALVIDGISEILSTIWSIISPIIESVVNGIGNVLKTTIDFIFSIIQALGNFFGFIGNIFNGIKSLIQGNTDEAIVYFKKAFANFVNIFVGVGNAIISVINNLWSLIFDSFKGTVNAIFGLVGKIGSWLGKTWDIEWTAKAPLIPMIPKYVPKLAQGAVIPPNREFMAILGDHKRGLNIETPLETMVQAFNTALANNGYGGETSVNFTVELDGDVLYKGVKKAEIRREGFGLSNPAFAR